MKQILPAILFFFALAVKAQCDTPCIYQFKMSDMLTDGWNGNSMTIVQGTNSTTISLTAFGTDQTVDVPLCYGEPFDVVWNAGGAYPQECVLEIISPSGQTIYKLNAGNPFQDSVIFSATALCDEIICPIPASLRFSEVGPEAATLLWDAVGGASSWEVMVLPKDDPAPTDDEQGTLVGTPSFSLVLENPEDFAFYVRTVCDQDKSQWISKNLDCSKPYNLVYVDNSRFYDFYTTWTGAFSSQWEILLQSASDPEPDESTVGIVTSESTFKTDGLVEGDYSFYIRSRCSDENISGWNGPMNFTVECGQPTGVTANGGSISWTPIGPATGWEVFISDMPFQPTLTDIGTFTSDNPYIADNLNVGTTYYTYVRSVCSDGVTSVWSQRYQFIHEELGVSENSRSSIQIFPVPAGDILNVNSTEIVISVRIFDLMGKEVASENLEGNAVELNFSALQSGMYFAHIVSENGNHHIKKFIKK